MPRERINTDPQASPELDKYATAIVGDPADLHVGWNKDGEWVQVGFEADISYFQFAAENPNGRTSSRTIVWTPVLSTHQIEKLIASLRKAKRKAYKNGTGLATLTQP